MLKDLKKVSRPARHRPGMQDFFILILAYSYYNRSSNVSNEFSIPQTTLSDYFGCTVLTVKRWCAKLRDLGFLKYVERDNAGKSVYYKDRAGNKVPYTIPKYKKIRIGEPNEIKFLNVYSLDQKGLNQYMIDHVEIDVLNNITDYKGTFNDFISFLSNRSKKNDFTSLDLDNLDKEFTETLSKEDKKTLQKVLKIHDKIEENRYYLDIKRTLDTDFPEFTCRYLEEGCLRLTHEICTTVNPEHTDKINESNYWRSSKARSDMLESMLSSNMKDITEYDVNGSIYRLTYNLNHDKLLPFDTDIYEQIWNNCGFPIPWSGRNREKFRKAFKLVLMPIYMKPHAIGYTASHWDYLNKYYAGHPRKYQKLNKEDQEIYERFELFTTSLNIDVKTFLEQVRDAMYLTLNTKTFIKSDIFTLESNLHILIRRKLLDKGIKCVNVYDGFYVVKSQLSKAEFSWIYDECVQELKTNMKNGIGTRAI